MKTKLKKQLYKLLITFLVAIAIVLSLRLGLFTPHHNLAQRPDILYRIVDIELPDTLRTEQYNNLDRAASSFDCFDCIITFKDTLSDNTIAELDYLCQNNDNWEKKQIITSQEEHINTHETYYCYIKEGTFHSIVCLIYDDHAKVEYSIDEMEGVYFFLSLLALFAIIVSIQILRLIIMGVKLLKNHHTNSLQQ
ncbi:MAG: hypothetical protein IKB70_09920 [Bacilli bacterium]|nr:hypothetical protein [Bacilli bacterium]